MNWIQVLCSEMDKNPEAQEYLFPVKGFSRLPSWEKDAARTFALSCLKEGKRTVLEWDLLLTQNSWEISKELLSEDFFHAFSAVRVQDLGAYRYLSQHYPQKKLQLILEHGNHNFESLFAFSKSSPQLERMILSPQIPLRLVQDYAQKLPCPVEVLFEGPLLLSYTPRKLLSRLGENEVRVRNLESQTDSLYSLENENGTFIFHSQRLSLQNFQEELNSIPKLYLRHDGRGKEWAQGITSGFSESNESAEVFVHLKNAYIEREDGLYAGEVIDVQKEKFIGISLAHPTRELKIGDELVFKTPEGRLKEQTVTQLYDFLLRPLERGQNGDIVFIPHRGVVSVRSSVYFK